MSLNASQRNYLYHFYLTVFGKRIVSQLRLSSKVISDLSFLKLDGGGNFGQLIIRILF